MNHDFWLTRWKEGQIGFHQDQINGYLTRHWSRTGPVPADDTVLVPLCGKSKDMLWLAEQGHKVLGIEFSPLAIEAFFEENGPAVSHTKITHFDISESDHISLWCGDFFDLGQDHIQGIRRVYDRASLIALPPEMRQQYASHLTNLLPSGSAVLLVTMEYPQQEMTGPPFSVHSTEVYELYQDSFKIEQLEEIDILADNPHFRDRGLTSLLEKSYLMTKM